MRSSTGQMQLYGTLRVITSLFSEPPRGGTGFSYFFSSIAISDIRRAVEIQKGVLGNIGTASVETNHPCKGDLM